MTRESGCGLAGLDETAIRDHALQNAPENVQLPATWRAHSLPNDLPRVIVAGSRSFSDERRCFDLLNRVQERIGEFVLISGGADALGELYAVDRGLTFKRFPADWDLGKAAGHWRNNLMAWDGTHLCAFWDGESRGTQQMIEGAREAGLKVGVFKA